MRLLFVAAVAIAGLAGAQSSASQPATDHGGGVSIPYAYSGDVPEPMHRSSSAAALAAYQQMHFACEVDQKSLCAGKTGSAIGRCLRDHVKTVSSPCQAAIRTARLADQGRL